MNERTLTRRGMLGLLGGSAVGLACGGSDTETPVGTSSSSSASSSSGVATSASSSSGSPAATSWATGGTKSMTASATYPDPFATPSESCVVARSLTEGPCTEAADPVRQDVTEGSVGLPMRLSFRVVDADCTPIANAKVKIWHTQLSGSYSGDTPNNAFCLKDQVADAARHSFRGVQTTNADGRVDFDSCFPGWYAGRAIHIHFTVSAAGKTFSSQVVFEDELAREIFAAHPEYTEFGQPDTTNASDGIVGSGPAAFMLATARMSDGAMLASKQLVCPLA